MVFRSAAHQALYVGSAGIGQAFQVITAFQKADESIVAITACDIEQFACCPVEVIFFQIDIRQRVAVVRIKPGGDNHQIGLEIVEGWQYPLAECSAKPIALRYYLRDETQLALARRAWHNCFPDWPEPSFYAADICRSELLFEMEGVDLEFRPDALKAVARKALERKTGARGLRSILEGILLDTMYEIPSQQDVSKVVIDESVIDGSSQPLMIYENSEKPAKAAPEA